MCSEKYNFHRFIFTKYRAFAISKKGGGLQIQNAVVTMISCTLSSSKAVCCSRIRYEFVLSAHLPLLHELKEVCLFICENRLVGLPQLLNSRHMYVCAVFCF